MTERVEIGDAVLYCGDCLEVLPTLEGVDAVVTDPPYGMQFQSNYYKGKNGKPNASGHNKVHGDNSTQAIENAVSLRAKHSKYVFLRWNNVSKLADEPRSIVVWVKPNWSMGDLKHEHGRQYELIAFYPGENHAFPGKRPADVVYHQRSGNLLHPTQKPELLMQQVVSWTDGVVCDPYMGSGTTGVACAQLGRKFIGIELEPRYFDIACKRIEQAYAQGRLFDDIPQPKPEPMKLDL